MNFIFNLWLVQEQYIIVALEDCLSIRLFQSSNDVHLFGLNLHNAPLCSNEDEDSL